MSEVMFVLKSFGLAIVLTLLMQLQVGDNTLENKAEAWLRTSPISKYLQGVATGAVKASKAASKSLGQMISSHSSSDSQSNRASR